MSDDILTTENDIETPDTEIVEDVVAPESVVAEVAKGNGPVSASREDRRMQKNSRRSPRTRAPRIKPEFDQRIIDIRRVTRVVAGGRRFSFSVCVVAGNRRGAVGVGTGKAGDTAVAVEKAYRSALKNKIIISQTEDGSIPHEVQVKYSSGIVKLYPAPGRGIIAGGAVRDVLELAGVRGVGAKILSRSKNKLNNATATIKALSMLTKNIKQKHEAQNTKHETK
jgi:small subunit ribosomal protein S5